MKSNFADLMTIKFNPRGSPFSMIILPVTLVTLMTSEKCMSVQFFYLHFAGDTGDMKNLKIYTNVQVKSKFTDLITRQFNSRGSPFFWIFLLVMLVTLMTSESI